MLNQLLVAPTPHENEALPVDERDSNAGPIRGQAHDLRSTKDF
jgi:hypothetical protein